MQYVGAYLLKWNDLPVFLSGVKAAQRNTVFGNYLRCF